MTYSLNFSFVSLHFSLVTLSSLVDVVRDEGEALLLWLLGLFLLGRLRSVVDVVLGRHRHVPPQLDPGPHQLIASRLPLPSRAAIETKQ